MLNILPEDPELGVVLKGDKAALSGVADLSTNHSTAFHQPINIMSVCTCVTLCVCVCVLPAVSCPGNRVHLTSGREQTDPHSGWTPPPPPDSGHYDMSHFLLNPGCLWQRGLQLRPQTSCQDPPAQVLLMWQVGIKSECRCNQRKL